MNISALGLGAALGLITGTWEKIKNIFYKFYSLFIITIKLEGAIAYAMCMYLIRNYNRSRIGDIEIHGHNEYVRPLQKNQLVVMRRISQKPMLWRRGRQILSISRDYGLMKIRFLRWTIKPYRLITEAVEFYNTSKYVHNGEAKVRFFVTRKQGSVGQTLMDQYMASGMSSKSNGESDSRTPREEISAHTADKYTCEIIGWELNDIGQPHLRNAIRRMSLSKEAENAFEEAKRWLNSEGWFKEHNIPWKLGWLLIGMPGTGKTEFARSTAQALDMPVFFFDLATMTNQDFVEAWSCMMDWIPCMALFEDIHTVFNKGKNITAHGDAPVLNFDCFLNVLDGIQNSEGIFTVITSNNINKVDSALGGPDEEGRVLTRPGRVNRILKFEMLTKEGRIKMAKQILGDFGDESWMNLVDEYESVTGAQFQAVCTEKALKLWMGRN